MYQVSTHSSGFFIAVINYLWERQRIINNWSFVNELYKSEVYRGEVTNWENVMTFLEVTDHVYLFSYTQHLPRCWGPGKHTSDLSKKVELERILAAEKTMSHNTAYSLSLVIEFLSPLGGRESKCRIFEHIFLERIHISYQTLRRFYNCLSLPNKKHGPY